MIKLVPKLYPLEWTIGAMEVVKYSTPNWRALVNTILLMVIVLKIRREGFRFSMWIYLMGLAVAYMLESDLLQFLIGVFFTYTSYRLKVFHLPSEGAPVGYIWVQNMCIFYPCVQWLRVRNYGAYMEDAAKKDVNKPLREYYPSVLFKVMASQLYRVIVHVYKEPQALHNPNPYPLIVLSHGLASHCNGYTVIARYLAQQGYVVVCPEHLEGIRNIHQQNEDNRVYRKEQLMVRVSTIREVLDFVYDEARINALIGISLDYTRVSIIGHSFGGTTAIYSSMVDKRITGVCIAYDPCLYILDENQSYESMTIPVYCINADEFYRTLYPYMHNDRRLEELYEGLRSPGLQLYISGQQHADFSDLPIVLNGECGLYNISRNVHEIPMRFNLVLLLTTLMLSTLPSKQNIMDVVRERMGQEVANLIRWNHIQQQK